MSGTGDGEFGTGCAPDEGMDTLVLPVRSRRGEGNIAEVRCINLIQTYGCLNATSLLLMESKRCRKDGRELIILRKDNAWARTYEGDRREIYGHAYTTDAKETSLRALLHGPDLFPSVQSLLELLHHLFQFRSLLCRFVVLARQLI